MFLYKWWGTSANFVYSDSQSDLTKDLWLTDDFGRRCAPKGVITWIIQCSVKVDKETLSVLQPYHFRIVSIGGPSDSVSKMPKFQSLKGHTSKSLCLLLMGSFFRRSNSCSCISLASSSRALSWAFEASCGEDPPITIHDLKFLPVGSGHHSDHCMSSSREISSMLSDRNGNILLQAQV